MKVRVAGFQNDYSALEQQLSSSRHLPLVNKSLPVATVNSRRSVNRIVASQLAQRARSMSDVELEQLFEDLLNVETIDSEIPQQNGGDDSSDGSQVALRPPNFLEKEEEVQQQTYTVAATSKTQDEETRGGGQEEEEEEEEKTEVGLPSLSRSPDVSEEMQQPSFALGKSDENMSSQRVLQLSWNFVQDHLDSFQLGAAALASISVVAIASRLISDIFSEEQEEEQEQEEQEQEQISWNSGSDMPLDHSPPIFDSFNGHEYNNPQEINGKGGGVLWSRDESSGRSDNSLEQLSNTGSNATGSSSSVLWTRRDTGSDQGDDDYDLLTSRALEDNVE